MTSEFLTSLIILKFISSTFKNTHIGNFSTTVEKQTKQNFFDMIGSKFSKLTTSIFKPSALSYKVDLKTVSDFDLETSSSEFDDRISFRTLTVLVDDIDIGLEWSSEPLHMLLSNARLTITPEVYELLSRYIPKFYPSYVRRAYSCMPTMRDALSLPSESVFNIYKDKELKSREIADQLFNKSEDMNIDNLLAHQPDEDINSFSPPDVNMSDSNSPHYDDDYSYDADEDGNCMDCYYDINGNFDYCDYHYCECESYEDYCRYCKARDEQREQHNNLIKYEPKIKIEQQSSVESIIESFSEGDIIPNIFFDDDAPSCPLSSSDSQFNGSSNLSCSGKSDSIKSDSYLTSECSTLIDIEDLSDIVPLKSSDPSDDKRKADWLRKLGVYERSKSNSSQGNRNNVPKSHTSIKKVKVPRAKRKIEDVVYERNTPQGQAALRARQLKKAEKIKAGLVWKQSKKSNVGKDQKLINKAYGLMNDQKYAELSAKIEDREIQLENLREPNINSEFYNNYYKEREYMEKQRIDMEAERKKKTYANNEIHVNKNLNHLMDDWNSTELSGIVRFASNFSDLEKIESFIKENINDEVAVNQVVNSVAETIIAKPNLMDKVSNFLRGFLLKVKPLAYALDTMRDIPLSTDIDADVSEVFLGEAIKIGEFQAQFEGANKVDARDDNARRGELVHMDPLLRKFIIQRTVREKLISTRTDYSGVFSAELLFQLMSPSVCMMNASPEIVMAKMVHICSTQHTINIPKWSCVQFNGFITDNTLYVARALYMNRKKVSDSLGFSQHLV